MIWLFSILNAITSFKVEIYNWEKNPLRCFWGCTNIHTGTYSLSKWWHHQKFIFWFLQDYPKEKTRQSTSQTNCILVSNIICIYKLKGLSYFIQDIPNIILFNRYTKIHYHNGIKAEKETTAQISTTITRWYISNYEWFKERTVTWNSCKSR